jgi:hypothetical protein
MPFLYFAVRPDDQSEHMVYVKFGHTENYTKRFKAYGPACRFATVEYNYEISKNMPLDDYINQKVLEKNSSQPLVDFWMSGDSGRRTDWFTMHRGLSYMILSYMIKIKSLCSDDDYNAFSRYILSTIIADSDDDDTETNIDAFSKLTTKECFFPRNFKSGGMMPLREMKRHPEWETQYIGQVSLNDFNMCRSCKKRAFSGCCPEYSATNRIKVRMVLGWHQDEDSDNDDTKTYTDAFSKLTIKEECFFKTNFKSGGMMPLKEMMRHPEWETEYIGQINLKDFNMCKSCTKRAFSGCCPHYSATNRNKIRMVLGWHQGENA